MKRKIRQLLQITILLGLIFLACPAMGVSYQWETQVDEVGFFIEVPAEYRWTYSPRKNGVIVTFTYESAAIEIRSFSDDTLSELTMPELVNQKAARLASVYNGVRLLYEKPSAHRPDLYLASWEIIHQGARYTEQTALWKDGDKIIAISCVAPTASLVRYQVAFENAIFSLLPDKGDTAIPEFTRNRSINLLTRMPSQEETKPKEEKPIKKEQKKETKPAEKTTPAKKEEPPKTNDMDSFLPPLK